MHVIGFIEWTLKYDYHFPSFSFPSPSPFHIPLQVDNLLLLFIHTCIYVYAQTGKYNVLVFVVCIYGIRADNTALDDS